MLTSAKPIGAYFVASSAKEPQKHTGQNVQSAGQKGDAWKKQLATVTGVKYKPGPQQEDSWEDSTGVYDTDGNQLSLEDISDDDDDDDDAWVDDFGDDTGVLEDKEIFNMDTGWSIQDFEGIVQQPPERQVQVSSCSPLAIVHQHLLRVLLGAGSFCTVSIECSLAPLCCACTADPVRHLTCLAIVIILHCLTAASYCMSGCMRHSAWQILNPQAAKHAQILPKTQ